MVSPHLEGDEWSEATAQTARVAPAQVEGEGGEGATEYGDAGKGGGEYSEIVSEIVRESCSRPCDGLAVSRWWGSR